MDARLSSANTRKDYLALQTRYLNGTNRTIIGSTPWACPGCVANARIDDRRRALSVVSCQRAARGAQDRQGGRPRPGLRPA
eukprot:6535827-Lingulodinium_polyedra.AAC.1